MSGKTEVYKKGQEYAILTDEITKAWSGFLVKAYKKHKDLKKENLRDNMTNFGIDTQYVGRSHHYRNKQGIEA